MKILVLLLAAAIQTQSPTIEIVPPNTAYTLYPVNHAERCLANHDHIYACVHEKSHTACQCWHREDQSQLTCGDQGPHSFMVYGLGWCTERKPEATN